MTNPIDLPDFQPWQGNLPDQVVFNAAVPINTFSPQVDIRNFASIQVDCVALSGAPAAAIEINWHDSNGTGWVTDYVYDINTVGSPRGLPWIIPVRTGYFSIFNPNAADSVQVQVRASVKPARRVTRQGWPDVCNGQTGSFPWAVGDRNTLTPEGTGWPQGRCWLTWRLTNAPVIGELEISGVDRLGAVVRMVCAQTDEMFTHVGQMRGTKEIIMPAQGATLTFLTRTAATFNAIAQLISDGG